MQMRNLPLRPLRATIILMAALCAVAVTPQAGQQAPDSARVVPASSAREYLEHPAGTRDFDVALLLAAIIVVLLVVR